MRHKPSISFEIPLPWTASPVRIEASGEQAVIVAGIVVIVMMIVIAFIRLAALSPLAPRDPNGNLHLSL